MQGISDPCLKWSAKLLRLALGLECRVTQISVGRDAELLRLASNAGLLRPPSKVFILKCEVSVLVQNATFALK